MPGGAAASRQHLRTHPASALPSRRHQRYANVDESGRVASESECRSCSERGQSHWQACRQLPRLRRDSSRRGPSGPSRPRPRSEARPGIVPDGRQLRDSIYSRITPVPCHHAATIDTPARSSRYGAGATRPADRTTVPTVPDSRTVAWGVRFPAVLGRPEPIPTSVSFPTASTHTSTSTQAQWLQVRVRGGGSAPIPWRRLGWSIRRSRR